MGCEAAGDGMGRGPAAGVAIAGAAAAARLTFCSCTRSCFSFSISRFASSATLSRGDLVLPRGDVTRMRRRFRIATGGVLFASHERLEALRELLLSGDELVLLREDTLARRLEFLFALIDRPLLHLELLLAGAKALLAADDRVAFVGEGRPLPFEDAAVFLDLRGPILEGGLALLELGVAGFQAFFDSFQRVECVFDGCFGHLQHPPEECTMRAEPPRHRRVNGNRRHQPPVSKIGPRTVSPPLRTSTACFSIEWSVDRIFSTCRYRTSLPWDRSSPSNTIPSTRNPSLPRSWLSPSAARSITTRDVSSLSRSILKK